MKRPGAITQTEKTQLPWVTYQRYASYTLSAITLPALIYTAWLLLKAKTKEKPLEEAVKPYEEIIAEAGEPSYEGRKATIAMKSLEDLAKISESLAKPILHTQKTKPTPTTSSTEQQNTNTPQPPQPSRKTPNTNPP